MGDMGNGQHEAAGSGLRRARTAAWIVTVVMGGTTMAFQVYHAVELGHMPWPLAVLYGIVPLLIALLVLEIVAEWREAPWPAKAAAYAIMGAAMFLSASATGAVVLHAAPGHFSLLPGALLDAAELLAAFFILNGPSAAQAVAKAAARERELLGQAAAERSAREQSETSLRAELSDLRARAGHEIEALRSDRASAQRDLESAQRETAEALTRAEDLARRLAGASAHKKPAKAPAGARNGGDDDLSLEMRALNLLVADPELRKPRMGGELARKLEVSPATGRRLHAKLSAQDLPDSLSDTGR
jgi:hypothetical protein